MSNMWEAHSNWKPGRNERRKKRHQTSVFTTKQFAKVKAGAKLLVTKESTI